MDQSSPEPILLEFGAGISPDKAERVIKALGEEQSPSRSVVLKFEEYPYVNVAVGWRIGNALRRYSGALLEVVAPPFLDGKGVWFRSFTSSCLGDAIAAHAGKITCGGTDHTARVRSYYAEKADRSAQNAVVWGELHAGTTFNPEQEDLFREAFLSRLRYVNARPSFFDPGHLRDLSKLAFEAIQNIYDHARRKPLPDRTKIVSYALLRYYQIIGQNHPDPAGRLAAYTARLPSVMPRRRTDFIEVCVNDDGVGIAARQAQEPSIYWGPKENEEKAVVDALTARSSVKLRAHDSRVRGTPGQGYTYIETCLRALHAFAVLRTGRLLAVLDGTDESGEGFSLVPGDLGYMPGTTLDVLIPILKEGDGQPSLFPDE